MSLREQYQALATLVAPLLGEGFRAEPAPGLEPRAWIVDEAGRTIVLRDAADGEHKEVEMPLPEPVSGVHKPFLWLRPEQFKDPAWLANQIHRDLLPAYDAALERCAARKAGHAEQSVRREELLSLLALSAQVDGPQVRRVFVRRRPWNGSSVGQLVVEVEPDGSGVDLHITGLDGAEGAALIRELLGREGWAPTPIEEPVSDAAAPAAPDS
ncbi:hypothetical protein SLUN_00080 [Streptomyces lunaelactis]|uniref:Uncharacterized protein n=1 Tax=Streptomyces lunaelactis TaxID=1535768 RepID=A0A2R4SVN4_9ACTN|nr:hypothetical protein [Streptomyces lunaelactis]AVZ70902.1 hypothetical protein SLUN_00080 [Streptomyces lunaelactis]NUK26912.1 hypothetical protein [Streptomyces lunaelactis]NUK85631.1 hypothetical protein [Streptomyces lunaelactis]